jgi:hypothetical protein
LLDWAAGSGLLLIIIGVLLLFGTDGLAVPAAEPSLSGDLFDTMR